MTAKQNRNYTLDIIRTVAIILMVIFHFIYDLKFYNFIDWNTPDGDGWRHFRWLIISLFFLCLGASLSLAYQHRFIPSKFLLRSSQIALGALLISITTFFTVPNNWIFFGVLHFLTVASFMVISFVRYPKVSFVIGSAFLLVGVLQIVPSRWPFHLLFDNLPQYTNDYVAIFPWLGMVFYGVTIAHSNWFKTDPLQPIFFARNAKSQKGLQNKILLWPGQHSLSIYLLHQPILLGFLYLFTL